MAPWFDFLTHPATVAGVFVAGSWIFRRRGKALLQLVAGLIAILLPDERSRTDRALEVLRIISAEETKLPKMRNRHRVTQGHSIDKTD